MIIWGCNMSEENYIKSTEIERFEKASGLAYRDFFSDVEQPIAGLPENYEGKSLEEISTFKDIGYSAGAAFKDFLKSSMALGMEIEKGIEDYQLDKEFDKQGMSRVKDNLEWDSEKHEAVEKNNSIDLEPSYESKTTAGGITYGLTKGVLGYATAARTLGAAGLTGAGGVITKASLPRISLLPFAKTKEAIQVGKVLSPVINNMLGNVTAFWVDKENTANILKEHVDIPFVKNIFDYWAIDEDDTTKERALKHAADALFGDIAGAVVIGGVKYIKQGLKNSNILNRLSKSIKNIDETAESTPITTLNSVSKSVKSSKKTIKPDASLASEVSTAENKLAKMIQGLRTATPENYTQLKARALDKFSDAMGIDFSDIETSKVREFIDTDNPEIDKVIASVYNEEKVADNFLVRMKEIKTELDAGNISTIQRDKKFEDSLLDLADSFAATQDAASKSGRALGFASKSKIHKDIKGIINGIVDNADTMDREIIWKALSEAGSIDELSAKFNKLLQVYSDSNTGGFKRAVDRFVALEQAGLMTNPHTVLRNIWTALEMMFVNAPEDVIARGVGKTRGFMRKLIGGGENYDLASATQGLNFAKNLVENVYEVSRYAMDKIAKRPTGESPVVKYRKSISGAKTYLPKTVGETFNNSTTLGKWGNKWMKISGVGLSEGIDDFMGNVFYRTEVQARARAYVDKIVKEKNITKAQADSLYKKTIQNVMDVSISDAKQLALDAEEYLVANAISKKSRNYALEQTFRGGQGGLTEALTSLMRGPAFLARPVIPFVKVASTIAIDRFLNDRTYLGLFNPKTWSRIKAGGKEADRLIAKQLTGTGILTLGGYLYESGMLTGDYPENAEERALWKAYGIMPNSVRIPWPGGKSKYISLDGLGVIALGLKAGAKASQAFEEYDLDATDERTLIDSFILKSVAIGETAASETILRYVGDFMKSLENGDEKGIQKIKDKIGDIGISVIPRLGEGLLSDTHESMQVADSLYEKVIKKFGASTKPALDLFGKPVKAREKFFGPLAGFNMSESEPDLVLDEMYRVGAFVEEPHKTMKINNVSLKLENEHVDAIKLRMEEKGLYEHLEKIINSGLYKSLTNSNDRAKVLKSEYNKARRNALIYTIKSYPELQEQFRSGIIGLREQYEPTRSDVNAILDVPTLR